MGSRHGLLLASGARRYCCGIHASFFLLFTPLLPFSHSVLRWCSAKKKKKRDWSDENPYPPRDAILRL